MMLHQKSKRVVYTSYTLRQPFDIDVNERERNGNKQFTVQVVPLSQALSNQQTEVVGKLKKPSGTSHIVQFTPTDDGNWSYELKPEEQGKYRLNIRVTAYTQDGDRLDFTPEPLSLINAPDDSVFEKSEPEPPVKVEAPEPVIQQPEPQPEPQPEAQSEPKLEETSEETSEENAEVTEESEKGYTQIILYSGLGLVNILIILIVFLIYRKLFKKTRV